MKRTIALVTAARAKGVELPGEWFGWVCPVCNEQVDKTTSYCNLGNRDNNYQRVDSVTTEYRYIGPDLTLPENLHHACTVADALNGEPVSIKWCKPFNQEPYFCVDVKRRVRTAPERHLALVAACEAALGIERGEVGV